MLAAPTTLVAASARAADHVVAFPVGSSPYYAYSPSTLDIPVNDTVTFNGQFTSHPLVWTNGDFPTQSTGTTRTFTFTKAGEYPFHCDVHASMVGSVRVSDAPAGGGGGTDPPADPGGDQGSPATPAGGGSGPGADVTAPTVRPASAALRFRGRTAALRLTADEAGTASATLGSRGKVLARGDGSLRAGTVLMTLRLTRSGVARLRGGRRVKARLELVVRDAAGNRRTVRRTLSLRR